MSYNTGAKHGGSIGGKHPLSSAQCDGGPGGTRTRDLTIMSRQL